MNQSTAASVSKTMPAAGEAVWANPWIGFLPIAALYLILGFYQLDNQSLWTDEVISVRRAVADGSIWALMSSQSPLYFMLLRWWSEALGTGEFALRSLSAFLGLGAIGLVYALALQLFDRRTAVFAGVLLATSPYFIWYSQEVRYITLMVAVSMAATYCFYRALSTDRRSWWIMYGAASALAIFTFLATVFLFVAQGLYVICSALHRRRLRRWLACQSAVFILFAAWFGAGWGHKLRAAITNTPVVVTQEQPRSRRALPASDVIGAIPYTLFAFSAGFSLGPSVRDLHTSRSMETLQSYLPSLAPPVIIFAAAGLLGLVRLRRSKSVAGFLLTWLGVPIVLVFMAGTLTSYHVYNTRYVALTLPAYLLIIAAGIGGLRRPVFQIVLLAAVLSVNGVSLANYYFEPRYGREDTRSAAAYLQASTRPDDSIIVVGSSAALQYYYKGSAPMVLFDARRDDSTVAANLRELADRHKRLWLVEVRPWQTDPQGKVRPALDKLGRRAEQRNFAGVEVYGYALH